jgi:tripartite-type tricarboxylate transporter receptor subunit TctC
MKYPHLKYPRRKFLRLAAAAVALVAVSGVASAQNYPSRPITMIVPYPPGGPTDTLGRIFSERMRGSLGQPVIVENVGGAGGTIGVARVVRAAADGHTINFSNVASHVFSSIVYKLQYDMLTDLEPVALLTISPFWLLASNSVPAKNLRELITWLKSNPNKATWGIVEALADPAVRERLTGLGVEILPREQQTPEGLRAYHKAEIEKWRPIIEAANIKPE